MVTVPNAPGRPRGAATQTRILQTAVQIASVEGLEAMSLATLAKATSMSKSGLFAHFRSKEALQLAIIDEAERMFMDAVTKPMRSEPEGLARVSSMVHGYVDYMASRTFEGGCFFTAAAHEFDGRPGAVRDRVAAFFGKLQALFRSTLVAARRVGDLRDDADIELVVFELAAIGMGSNLQTQLLNDRMRARDRAQRLARVLVERLAPAGVDVQPRPSAVVAPAR